MLAPRSRGLFSALISESGTPIAMSAEAALNASAAIAARLDCRDASAIIECLRRHSAAALVFAARPGTGPGWAPAVDGVDLVANPVRLLLDGRFNRDVSVAAGCTE